MFAHHGGGKRQSLFTLGSFEPAVCKTNPTAEGEHTRTFDARGATQAVFNPLAYTCSPRKTGWKKKLTEGDSTRWRELTRRCKKKKKKKRRKKERKKGANISVFKLHIFIALKKIMQRKYFLLRLWASQGSDMLVSSLPMNGAKSLAHDVRDASDTPMPASFMTSHTQTARQKNDSAHAHVFTTLKRRF